MIQFSIVSVPKMLGCIRGSVRKVFKMKTWFSVIENVWKN
ncbi:MAG: hypothetical protein CM15mL4_2930 [uncultured marine virus]|nr:MAG: hypothetical protein CM15mL4_2930 [uncultured marine virus]